MTRGVAAWHYLGVESTAVVALTATTHHTYTLPNTLTIMSDTLLTSVPSLNVLIRFNPRSKSATYTTYGTNQTAALSSHTVVNVRCMGDVLTYIKQYMVLGEELASKTGGCVRNYKLN